jgi:hypothetical protein
MKENAVWILTYMPFVAAFAYMIGWVCGEQVCRRKNAEEKVAELHDQLEHTCSGTQEQRRQFKELRSVLNDAHKHIVAVSKALKIPARYTTQNQWPDLTDPAVPKGVGLKTAGVRSHESGVTCRVHLRKML